MTDVTVAMSTAVVTVTETFATVNVLGANSVTVDAVAGNVQLPSAVRWSPTFSATGLAFTGSGATYPTYNSYYVKSGQLVSFAIAIDLTTVTNFGTGQYKCELPFTPLMFGAHFSGWVWRDPEVPADDSNHIILNVDYVGTSKTLDMHFLAGAPAEPKAVIEKQLKQGDFGYSLTTVSKIYINGSYITGE